MSPLSISFYTNILIWQREITLSTWQHKQLLRRASAHKTPIENSICRIFCLRKKEQLSPHPRNKKSKNFSKNDLFANHFFMKKNIGIYFTIGVGVLQGFHIGHEKQLYIAYTGTASHWRDGEDSAKRYWNITMQFSAIDLSAKTLRAPIFHNSSVRGRRAPVHLYRQGPGEDLSDEPDICGAIFGLCTIGP